MFHETCLSVTDFDLPFSSPHFPFLLAHYDSLINSPYSLLPLFPILSFVPLIYVVCFSHHEPNPLDCRHFRFARGVSSIYTSPALWLPSIYLSVTSPA